MSASRTPLSATYAGTTAISTSASWPVAARTARASETASATLGGFIFQLPTTSGSRCFDIRSLAAGDHQVQDEAHHAHDDGADDRGEERVDLEAEEADLRRE